MATILDKIIARKKQEAAALYQAAPLAAWQNKSQAGPPVRDFKAALASAAPYAVIAEFKRRSPSAGELAPDKSLASQAWAYREGGAAAISVLCDSRFFGGSLEDLAQVRQASGLPVLCKDFLVDPVQVHRARAAGADAVLLIAAALDPDALGQMAGLARELGMAALCEVHAAQELDKVLASGADLLGVNNRDLASMRVDIGHCLSLAEKLPAGTPWVAESGLNTRQDLERLAGAGFSAFLIGSALMKSPDPAAHLRQLRGEGNGAHG